HLHEEANSWVGIIAQVVNRHLRGGELHREARIRTRWCRCRDEHGADDQGHRRDPKEPPRVELSHRSAIPPHPLWILDSFASSVTLENFQPVRYSQGPSS